MKTEKSDYITAIRDYLDKYTLQINERYSVYGQAATNEICRYILREGKYIRPRLFLLTAQIYGADYTPALVQCACSLELFHLFALAHDDIIDNDISRGHTPSLGCGGKYSNNPKTGNRILLGDILYSLAFETITSADISPDIKIELQKLMIETSVITAFGVLKEPLLSNESFDTINKLFRLYWQKTGMYTFSSPMVGGYLTRKENHKRSSKNSNGINNENSKTNSRLENREIKLLKELGSLWGCAFQLQDDFEDCLNTKHNNHSDLPAEQAIDNSSHKTKKMTNNTASNANPNDKLLKELFSNSTAEKEKYGTFENYVTKNITLLLDKARLTAEKLDLPENSRLELIEFAELFFYKKRAAGE
ncbi:MAG: polyprenyl synthetase family protein [Spirochaetes bacterium]|nr:polyprenyl synthetase family protein [Spirochaetota bacterium]MBN2769591.1 polyprenyl synthetase family protein [Spirochaetota bacterium]